VPIGGKTTGADNQATANFIEGWRSRRDREEFSLLDNFVALHPESPWVVGLLINKGLECRHLGYFSEALDAWQTAWDRGRKETSLQGRLLVDRAAGELADLSARLGRYDWLEQFFKEIKGRNIQGSATEKIAGARQSLWLMQNKPEDAFRCGPMALARIRARVNPALAFDPKVLTSLSTSEGMSLNEVSELAGQLKMKYVMARRDPGARIASLLPAVMHWKVGHYAALTEESNGRYRAEDPAFGDAISISQRAIDAGSSGYFLVPVPANGSLPSGWHSLTVAEGKQVWGKGLTDGNDPSRTRVDDVKVRTCPPKPTGMAQYNVHAMVVSLNLTDSPFGYTPPRGPPIVFTAIYSQREANQLEATFSHSNLGRKWTHGWFSYVQDDSQTPLYTSVYLAGGGAESYPEVVADMVGGISVPRVTYWCDYTVSNPPPCYVETAEFKPQQDSRAVLIKTNRDRYVKTYPDGSKDIFDHLATGSAIVYPRKIFLTKRIDATGNETIFTYNNIHRLETVTDAIGQVTTLHYDSEDPLKITSVTDQFIPPRSATLEYNDQGQLAKITDVEGLTSEFAYGDGDFITSLTTDYGTTIFTPGEDGATRWLEVTDPQGGKERTEFRHQAPGIPGAEATENVPQELGFSNSYLQYRNSFYWNKKAYQEALNNETLDYTKARLYHWLHTPENASAGILESTKEPYENRVWFHYPGQVVSYFVDAAMHTQPDIIARVVDGGSPQIFRYEYNDAGRVTKSIDPRLRETQFTYAPNLSDLTEVRQKRGATTDLLASYTYNGQHLPLTATDASGQETVFTYYPNGQIDTITNPKGEVTTFAYDPSGDGYLESITRPLAGAVTQFAYDDFGRVNQITNSDNYAVQMLYDKLNRLIRVTYPDNTDQQTIYTLLHPEWTKDRLNRWTHTYFDSIGQVVGVEDPEYRFTGYEWCGCGDLNKIIDSKGQITEWTHDVRGRITSKSYPDQNQEVFSYEALSGRLSTRLDAKGQTTNYSYWIDNNLKEIAYTNAEQATPNVSYTYDSEYNRLKKVTTDGTDETTYDYHPITTTLTLGAGRLASVNGPLDNDTITYTYDELGRVTNQSINGVANATSVEFDSLGRVESVTNPLGAFAYTYVNMTNRLDHVDIPGGQKTQYGYVASPADPRLQQIKNLDPAGAIISQFDYTYNAVGDIMSWGQRQAGAATANRYDFGYDAVDQLRNATLTKTSDQTVVKQYDYDYDAAGNRTTEQSGSAVTTSLSNELNQLVRQSGGGKMHFRGSVNEPSTVTVGGNNATVDGTGKFDGMVDAVVGSNTVPVVATDGNGNSRTNNYQVTVPSGLSGTLTYDLNGNLTNDGARTYEWDAADRLTAISYTGTTNRSEFAYDGLGRRSQITEKDGVTITSEKRLLWCGNELCEERDASGAGVTKRFFSQGEKRIGGADAGIYFYTKDHLGSVREMTDSDGVVRARYDYSPWGSRLKIEGDLDTEFGFTGFYFHNQSDLNFSRTRAYDSKNGKWISRDPIAERGGLNLYGYVNNDPVNLIDPLGLAVGDWWDLRANFKRSYDIGKEELLKHIGRNDLDDAQRHAEWQRRTACETNQFTAWASGLEHEIVNLLEGYPLMESMMDLHNNAVGREAASRGNLVDSKYLQSRTVFMLAPYQPWEHSNRY
jgi:RHS repeat-associated protein